MLRIKHKHQIIPHLCRVYALSRSHHDSIKVVVVGARTFEFISVTLALWATVGEIISLAAALRRPSLSPVSTTTFFIK